MSRISRFFAGPRSLLFQIAILAAISMQTPLFAQTAPDDDVTSREEFIKGFLGIQNGFDPGARLRALDQMNTLQQQVSASSISGAASATGWLSIGPQPTLGSLFGGLLSVPISSGRVSALAVDPNNPQRVYLGGAQGGIWRTTDGGTTWIPLTDQQPSLATGSIALDPANSQIIYVGTGEANFSGDSYYGVGVLKSIDGGNSWALLDNGGLFHGAYIGGVSVRPGDSNTVLAAVVNGLNSGIYLSGNGGSSWNRVSPSSSGFPLVPSLVAFANSQVAFAAVPGLGIYKSVDGGQTWNPSNGSPGASIATTNTFRGVFAIAPSTAANNDQITIYASFATSGSPPTGGTLAGFYKSTDSGSTWRALTIPDYCTPQCWYDNVIAVHPGNADIVFAGGSGAFAGGLPAFILRSTDGGTTWLAVTDHVHADQHAMAFTADGTMLYLGNDGGAYSTTNITTSPLAWNNLNQNLSLTQFYQNFAIDPNNAGIAYGGTQDNGSQRYSGSLQWQFVSPCGDGASNVITAAAVYINCDSTNSGVWKSATGTGIFQYVLGEINPADPRQFIPPMVGQSYNSNRLYFGTNRIWAHEIAGDGNDHWGAISQTFTGGNNIGAIAIAPSNPDSLYVGSGSHISKATNASSAVIPGATAVSFNLANFVDVTGTGLPTDSVTALAVHPTVPDTVYAVFNGFGHGHIFKSTVGGSTWIDVSGNLPDVPVLDIVIDPDAPNFLYVGTDIGVFIGLVSSTPATWSPLSNNLPRAAVFGLRLHRPSRTLRAATHGRGMWDLAMPIPGGRRRAVKPLSSPPIPMVNQPYSFATVDSADPSIEIPVNFSLGGDLPPGTGFTFATGVLDGTLTTPGLFDFIVTANYADPPSVTQEYELPVCQVDPAPPNLAVTIPINSPYVIGNINSNPLGIYSFDLVLGGLPPGMVLDGSTGMVSGSPTAAGTYNLRIKTSVVPHVPPDPKYPISVLSCPSGTTSDLFYQITVSCTGTQCQPQYEGYFDGLNSDNIWGWAWDRTQPDSAIQVDIYDSSFDVVPDGTVALASVNANLFRQDLLNAGKGDGNHAFVFPVPESLKDGQVHRIHVTFAGTKTDLGWSPRLLLAPPPAERFVGLHSSNSCDRIDGFAVDTWQSNVPIDVNVFDGGELLAVLNANLDASLVPATTDHGTHGFLYFTPDRLKDGAVHQIRISFAVSGVLLSNTNQTLSCAPPPPPTQTPDYSGFFDNATCTRVDGWGWDANRPDTPVDVNVYADGSRVATLTANLFSQDLLDKNIGNGAHRFVFFVPSLMKDGGSHHFSVQIAAQGTDLPISSAAGTEDITCAALPPPQPPPPAPIVNTNTGMGVGMSSGQPTGTTPAIDVTFASVVSPGITSFVSVDPSIVGQLPDGYAYPHAAINPVSFEISTTAVYGGPVSVAFRVPSETDATEFGLLRILHLENGAWVDHTLLAPDPQAPNFSLHTVTARVSSFSPFVLARLIQNPIRANVALTGSSNSMYGQAIALNARVSGMGSSATPTGTVTFTDGAQILAAVPLDSSGQAMVSTSSLGAGTHTIVAFYSGDSVFPQATGQSVQVVNPATLSVSADSAARFYGSANPVFTGTISGLQNNDTITATFHSAVDAFSPAGIYPITITLSDPNGRLGNYSVLQSAGTLTVSPAMLTITTNNKSRPYGRPNPALDGVVNGVVNGDAIAVTFTTPADQFSPAGGYAITPLISDPGNRLVNYDVHSTNGTLTVTAASLQITAHDKSRNYGSANPVFDGDISGLLNNDAITATFTSVANPSSPVGTYAITPVVNDPNGKLGNYNVAIQNGILTIIPTTLVVSANSKSHTYGQPNPPFDGTISGLQNGDNITATYSTTATAISSVGTYDITAALSDPTNKLGNYTVTVKNGVLTITAATLTVTPNHKSRMYGQLNPVLDGVITGIQNGDNITATFSTPATSASPIGNYVIVAALLDPGNKLADYAVTLNTDTLTITPAPLAVTANNKAKIYGQAVPTLDGTVTGIQNGDSITATFTTSATQSSPAGNYAIVASLQDPAGKLSNYTVTTNDGTLNVLAAPLVITADNQTKILNAPNPAFTASYVGFVLGEGPGVLSGTLTCTTAATTSSTVGAYAITCSGQSSGNYAINYIPGTLSILYASSGFCAGSPGHQVLVPIAASGTSVFNQGRTVPVKFRVCDANGVSIGTAGVVSSFRIMEEISGTVSDVNIDPPSATPDTSFRWDPTGQQWIFNVDTSGLQNNITLVFRITLNDGSAVDLQFGLK